MPDPEVLSVEELEAIWKLEKQPQAAFEITKLKINPLAYILPLVLVATFAVFWALDSVKQSRSPANQSTRRR